MGGASCIYQGIFRIVNRNRVELVDQSFELLVFLLRVIVLESDCSGFDTQRRVFVWTAVLCSRAVKTRRGFLKEKVVVAGENCPCNVKDILKVEGLTLGPVGVHGDESFTEGLLVVRVESAPEDGVALAYGYPTCAEEDLALSIELVLVVDDVSLVPHVLPGVFGGEVDELLP